MIPYGGSSVTGALGYVDCGCELLHQMPALRHVVVAVGSGGTMAGLVAALGPDRVLGVDAGAVPDPERRVHELVERARRRRRRASGRRPAPVPPGPGRPRLRDTHSGRHGRAPRRRPT